MQQQSILEQSRFTFPVWVSYLCGFLFLSLIMPKGGHLGDFLLFKYWSTALINEPFGQIYSHAGVNYHPLYFYWLWLCGTLVQANDHIGYHFGVYKILGLAFDFLGAMLCWTLIGKDGHKRLPLLPLFALLNLAYIYNSFIWGQVDSIYTFFGVASLIAAYRGRLGLSIICLLIGINFKLQCIFFFPVVGLVALPWLRLKWKELLKGLGIMLILQVIILIPFIVSGTLSKVWGVVVGAVGFYPRLSMNAFNIWYFLMPNVGKTEYYDGDVWIAGLSHHAWGTLMFYLASAIVLFPLLKHSFNLLKSKTLPGPQLLSKALLAGGLISLVFFYFPTQMHERYSHPAMLFFFLYAIVTRRWWIYIATSIAYFLNMEAVLKFYHIPNYGIAPFSPLLIAGIFGAVLIGGVLYMYRKEQVEPLIINGATPAP